MSGLMIRPFTGADAESVTRLWQLVFAGDPSRNNPADVIRRKQAVQPDLFLVALQEGELIGNVPGGYERAEY